MDKKSIGLIILILLAIPKLIDFLFSFHLCNFLALNIIEAKDVLAYVSTLTVVGVTLLTLYFSLKQFKLLNKTYIIPLNKKCYFYHKNDANFLYDSPDIENDDFYNYAPLGLYHKKMDIEFKNIGKGTANNFSISILYNKGESFYNLINQLCSPPKNYELKSDLQDDLFENCGVISSDDTKLLPFPVGLDKILQNICHKAYLNAKSPEKTQSMKNNILVNKEHKICSIKICSTDILDAVKTSNDEIYDVYFQLNPKISLVRENGVQYEVFLTIKETKQKR